MRPTLGAFDVRTLLDDVGPRWFLDGIAFRGCTLSVLLAEPRENPEASPLTVQGVEYPEAAAIEVMPDSRRFEVLFENVVAHQVIREEFVVPDDYERAESHDALRVLDRSHFLDRVLEHGWLLHVEKKMACHFEIRTYEAIVDVIATSEPQVSERSS
jgi:hypothetical protein